VPWTYGREKCFWIEGKLGFPSHGGPTIGSDFGPVPYGIKEHVQIVEDVVPSLAERQLMFWKTSNRVFRLGLVDADLSADVPVGAHRAKLEAANGQ
jgi:hypothetical protein